MILLGFRPHFLKLNLFFSLEILKFVVISKFVDEVAQWLAPRISSAYREVGCSSLVVSTDDPLG